MIGIKTKQLLRVVQAKSEFPIRLSCVTVRLTTAGDECPVCLLLLLGNLAKMENQLLRHGAYSSPTPGTGLHWLAAEVPGTERQTPFPGVSVPKV